MVKTADYQRLETPAYQHQIRERSAVAQTFHPGQLPSLSKVHIVAVASVSGDF
jgi:hypothetical protein